MSTYIKIQTDFEFVNIRLFNQAINLLKPLGYDIKVKRDLKTNQIIQYRIYTRGGKYLGMIDLQAGKNTNTRKPVFSAWQERVDQFTPVTHRIRDIYTGIAVQYALQSQGFTPVLNTTPTSVELVAIKA